MSNELIEKLAREHGIEISDPSLNLGQGKVVKPMYLTELEAFAKAYADNQEMYLLKVLAEIRQAMGNADKLMLDELAPAIAIAEAEGK